MKRSLVLLALLLILAPCRAQYTGLYGGLQPAKVGPTTITVNPGTFATADGSQLISSPNVLAADVSTNGINTSTTPYTGGMMSGAMLTHSTATNGTDVQLYLVQDSLGKLALVGDSSNVYGGATNASVSAGSASWTTGLPCEPQPGCTGFFDGNKVQLAAGADIPTPFGAGVDYYVVDEPNGQLSTTFGLAGSRGGPPIPATSSGFAVVKYGVQDHLDAMFGVGAWRVLRRVHFAFIWNWEWAVGAGGIPDFTADPRGDTVWLTDSGNAAWQVLNGVSAPGGAIADLSPWLSNLNRIVFLRASASGSSYIGAPGVPALIPVGSQPAMTPIQTDSQGKVRYQGGPLWLSVVGWMFVDPS